MQLLTTVLLALVSAEYNHDRDHPVLEVPVLFRSTLVPHGCTRYVRGFDITGVTTEVDLTFNDGIKHARDCFNRCASNPATCVSWVWKFTTDPNHRTCTLYSNFNLPSQVNIAFDVGKSTPNINNNKLMANNNNPQMGANVPQCTMFNSTVPDNHCMSGISFLTANNHLIC
ncbi:hypothetical protein HK103_000762 [Boothiomyces macroporosus]|uniref:Apple domain-containing protein n=1 Tax=Boothiomyces macroporosus TaxID=261099 RepID=A0AAD5UC38_9FUNG|nr:hypothetical protein HK103_000759 [Boothiomyces macroporosus]KAJ3253321.1 hypothetical protein HK103_000762 [Boothiomyces macroporosus]